MSAAIQAAMDALETHTQDAIEPEVVPDDPQAPPPAPTKAAVSLDDLLPDVEDLPPTVRGKPLRALDEERRAAIRQRDEIGRTKNDLESQLRVAQAALNVLGQAVPQQQQTPSVPERLTSAELLKRRGIDTSALYTDPDRVLSAAIEAGAELAKADLQSEISALRQQLEDVTGRQAVSDSRSQATRIRDAHMSAGQALKVDPQQWKEDAEFVTSFVLSRGLPVDDPQSYVLAGEALYRRGKPVSGQQAPPPAPQAGTGAPAPVGVAAGSAIASLSPRDRQSFDDIIAGFGERVKLSPEKKEQIARDVLAARKRR
jgi:hypothetical protein